MNFLYFDLLVIFVVILMIFLLISYSSSDYSFIEGFNSSNEVSKNDNDEKNGIHKYTITKKQEKQYNIYDNDGTLLYNIIGSFPDLIIRDNMTDKNLQFSRDVDTQNYQTIYTIDLGNEDSLSLNYNGANSVIANLNNYQELVTLTGKQFTYQTELLGIASKSSLTPTQIDNIETSYNEKRNNEKNETTRKSRIRPPDASI